MANSVSVWMSLNESDLFLALRGRGLCSGLKETLQQRWSGRSTDRKGKRSDSSLAASYSSVVWSAVWCRMKRKGTFWKTLWLLIMVDNGWRITIHDGPRWFMVHFTRQTTVATALDHHQLHRWWHHQCHWARLALVTRLWRENESDEHDMKRPATCSRFCGMPKLQKGWHCTWDVVCIEVSESNKSLETNLTDLLARAAEGGAAWMRNNQT